MADRDKKDLEKYYGWQEGDIQIMPTPEARKQLIKDPKKDWVDEKDADREGSKNET